ncbi:MAG: NAD(P)-binding domain-containing protein [Actinobacteria bacterium]|nr:NAD(P)-binding domain-containing protein [Actinomycetota bacterium]
MRTVVFGAGAIGSVIGAQLARAGQDVVLIARPAHAINAHGLKLWRPEGEQLVRVPATTALAQLDLLHRDLVVLLCVKGQDTTAALAQIADAIGTRTPVFCCQNGVGNEALAARDFSRVYGVVVNAPGQFHEPGVCTTPATTSQATLGWAATRPGSTTLPAA